MKNGTRIYTVSQVNTLIQMVLENSLPGRLTITGEITDFKIHHSGHCYFSLKDEEAVLPCVMWKSSFGKLKFRPENGMAVLGTGFIDVYEPQGKYQFYVERMEPAGVGAMQLAFEQVVRRLEAQGLFDEAHKKPIPLYPMPDSVSFDMAFELTTNEPAYTDNPIPGDLNGDKIVNFFDFAIMADNWLESAP